MYKVTDYLYNPRGFLERTEVTGKDGEKLIYAYEYDLAGRKTAEVAPKNYIAGQPVSQMNRTGYLYNKMNRVKTVTNHYTKETWNPVSNTWSSTPVSLVSHAYKYDQNGNLIKELDALGYQAGTGSSPDEIISSVTAYGKEYTYNLANKPLTMVDPVNKTERGLAFTYQYQYNALGRKTSETNANGAITLYGYNANGNVTSLKVQKTAQSPEQTVETNTYDYVGNLLAKTDGRGNTTTYTYNAFQKTRSITYPGDETIPSLTVTCRYDVRGNIRKQGDTNGTTDLYTYDNQGRVLSHLRMKNDGTQAITTTASYDKAGNKRFETDGNGNTTTYTYDGLGRVKEKEITVTDIHGQTRVKKTAYEYDANGNQTKETDWRGNTYQNKYDALNRLIQRTDPNSLRIQKLEYNDNHAQVKAYDDDNDLTLFQYDKNNRLIKTIDPENHTTSQTYDNLGNIKTKTDGRGHALAPDGKNHTTVYEYDEYNRLCSVTNPKGETTTYTYDANGNMLTQKDGKNNVNTYAYNARNNLTTRIDAGGTGDPEKTETYTYDASGRLKTKVDRNGNTTTYHYDAHGRLISETCGTLTTTYGYDNNGNQVWVAKENGDRIDRAYDEENRVKTKTEKIGATSFTSTYLYDTLTYTGTDNTTKNVEAGQWAEITTDPKNNKTTRIFDKLGRLTTVIADGQATTYAYNGNGSRKSVLYAKGKEDYEYYKDNLLKKLTNYKKDANGSYLVMDTYEYTYDEAHNQKTKIETINGVLKGTTSYAYDTVNRLEKVTEQSGKITSYTYDQAGNRETETVTQGLSVTTTCYIYNGQNRLTSTVTTLAGSDITETVTYTYDNNGNVIHKAKETEKPENPGETTDLGIAISGVTQEPQNDSTAFYDYDLLNQLIQVTEGAKTSEYTYNPEGRRSTKNTGGQVTKYLYENDKVVLETDGAGNQTARNVYGINLIARTNGTEKLYYFYNGHADVTALMDVSGNIVGSYYYDAFGNILETMGNKNNPIRYAGYQYDEETGLYYLNSRMYDPKIARFMQEDTYRGDKNDPLSLNLYTYCVNNPVLCFLPGKNKNMVNSNRSV